MHKKSMSNKKLQFLRQQFYLWAGHSSNPTILADMENWSILEANPAASQFLMYAPDKLKGLNISDLFHDGYSEKLLSRLSEIQIGKTAELKAKVNTSEGNVLSCNLISKLVPAENHNLVLIICRHIDNSRNIQKALFESEQRFRKIIEASPSAVMLVKDGRYIFSNQAGADMLGLDSPDSLKGKNVLETIHPDDRQLIIERMDSLKGKDTNPPTKLRILRPDGKTLISESISINIRYNGQPVTLIIGHDITEREKATDKLKQAEAEKDLILNSTSELFVHYDNSLKMLWANKAAADSVGMSPQNLIENYCYKVWHNRDKPCENCPVVKARDTGTLQEEIMMTPDGRHWNLRAYPVFDEHGKVNGIIEFGRDVTAELEIQQTIKKNQERFRMVLENLPDAVFAHDLDGNILMVNQKAVEYTNWSEQELLNMKVSDIDTEIISRDDRRKYWLKLKPGESVNIEVMHRTRVGMKYPAEVQIQKTEFNGQPLILAVARDITERRKMMLEIRDSEEKYKTLVENSLHSVVIIQDERIVFANEGACKLTGYSKEELTDPQKSILNDLLHPKDRDILLNRIRNRLRGIPEPSRYEFRIVTKSGQERWVEQEVCILIYQGRPAVQSFAIDITDRKQAEKSLMESRHETRMRERIAYILLTESGDKAYQEILEILMDAQDSKLCYFGYINEDGDLVCPSMTGEIWDICRVPDKDIIFPREKWAGLWGKSLIEKISLYSNSRLNPPEGHIQLESALVVPILYYDELIGQIAVANKPSGYTQKDLERLEGIARYLAPILKMRLEKARREAEREKAVNILRSSEEKFRAVFEQAPYSIVLIDSKTNSFVEFNDRAHEILGYTREEFQKIKVADIEAQESPEEVEEHIRKLLEQGSDEFETKHRTKDDRILNIIVNARVIDWMGERYFLCLFTDVTNIKQSEKALKEANDMLNGEKQLLNEKNLAMRELMTQMQEQKDDFKKQLQINVDRILMPMISRIESSGDEQIKKYIQLLKNNLEEITSPYYSRLASLYSTLTPREVEVCNMIRNGMSSKEISNALNVSINTVFNQRRSIRKKLKIADTDINLVTFLRSIGEN
jgi:PAS domain S-box-containing protein